MEFSKYETSHMESRLEGKSKSEIVEMMINTQYELSKSRAAVEWLDKLATALRNDFRDCYVEHESEIDVEIKVESDSQLLDIHRARLRQIEKAYFEER